MRKLMLSLATLFFMTGLAVAGQMVLVKFDKDKNEATFKDGDKEVTGKLTDKTKVTVTGKDGTTKEGKVASIAKQMSSPKAAGRKFDVTIKDGEITEVKIKSRK